MKIIRTNQNFALFSENYQEPKKQYNFNLFKKVSNLGNSVPFFKQQTEDYLKEKGQNLFKKIANKNKPTIKQKIIVGKKYLKYRKYLGDTYGKEKGMAILQNQKNYLKNLVNPSYKQIPLTDVNQNV